MSTHSVAQIVNPPMRRLVIHCEADRPFAMPLGETLGPYFAWRGLLGAALTDASSEVARTLFKPYPVGERTEVPTVPWRLRLGSLYARAVERHFSLTIDVFGEEPCSRVSDIVHAVRMAGSGRRFRDWRSDRENVFGLDIRDEQGRHTDKVSFTVCGVDFGPSVRLWEETKNRAEVWRHVIEAHLLIQTLSVLRERDPGQRKGAVLAVTGELDAAALCGNALRRLAVLDIATRAQREERTAARLARATAGCADFVASLAARSPLECADAVTIPVERRSAQRPRLGGLMGSARFTGEVATWLPAFVACEWLGIGESTAYGAGQVRWLPTPPSPGTHTNTESRLSPDQG